MVKTRAILTMRSCVSVVVAAGVSVPSQPIAASTLFEGGAFGILQAAGLLFFAFAGYARIATMGEEVRDPSRTIPRAIVIALATTIVIYAVVAVIAITTLGPALATSAAPLADVVAAAGWSWAQPVVRVAAAAGFTAGSIPTMGKSG